MDHALRTISYIADIGSIVVLMARRRMPRSASQDCIETTPGAQEGKKQYKMICHVFESEDVSNPGVSPRAPGSQAPWKPCGRRQCWAPSRALPLEPVVFLRPWVGRDREHGFVPPYASSAGAVSNLSRSERHWGS